MDGDKDSAKDDFLFELQRKALETERLVDDYDLRDEFLSVNVSGITEINEETGEPQIRALFTYSIKDDQELEEVISFIRLSYETQKDNGPDLDDLIGGLGISLN